MKAQRKLIQLLQSNRSESPKALRVENQSDASTIYLYGVIDEDFGVSAEALAKELDALRGVAVTLRINSPGGDVFDGRAMYAAIRQHGNVNAQIDGLAASAATYVAMAAKSISMIDGGFMMIHNAWTLAFGNKNDFIEIADLLDKFDQSIVSDYIKKTGKSAEEIAAMMDAETWMNAKEALEMGFVDNIFDGDVAQEPAESSQNFWDLSAFDNAPKALTENNNQTELWNKQRSMAERRLRILDACRS